LKCFPSQAQYARPNCNRSVEFGNPNLSRNLTQTYDAPPQSFPGSPSPRDKHSSERHAWQAEKLRLLWQWRRPLAATALAGFVLSTVTALLIPSSYTASAELMPPDGESSTGLAMISALAKSGSGLGSLGGDLLGLKSSGSLFVGMLRSESAQISLVEHFDLKKVYGVKLIHDARAHLDQRTHISEDRKSGIITISVTDRSPERAAALANAYIDRLNSLVNDLSTSSAHRERIFLEGRLKVARHDLDEASRELAQFSSQNSTLDIQQMGKAMLDAAGNVAGQLIAAESELQGLRQMYTDDNPRVRSLSGRVVELRSQLARLQGRQANVPEASSGEIPSTSLHSAAAKETPYPNIRSLPLLGVKYAEYYREAKIQETVYELLTEQYELAKIQEAKETPSVKVLDRARIPEGKSSPPRTLIVLLGTFFAVSWSIVLLAARSRWLAVAPDDPRNLLAQEAFSVLAACIGRFSGNNTRPANETSTQQKRVLRNAMNTCDELKQ
jgi:uncharacterized protein involved in exopolysaccharide biosynthesis